MPDNALTPEEVATALNITKNTVYEMVKRGELKAYRIGRKIRIDEKELVAYKEKMQRPPVYSSKEDNPSFIICGQDIILDILARHMETQNPNTKILRSYKGSYNGLFDLYNDKVNVATAHLWDGDSDSYNTLYVKNMLPGIPAQIFHLAKRQVGFYVKNGNPNNITTWEDFHRDDIVFVNREPGSGIRVLLDERLRLMEIDAETVKGYKDVTDSHLLAAGAVGRGYVDFALGNEKGSRQVAGIEFVPLQREDYDIIVKVRDLPSSLVQSMLRIIESDKYRNEVLSLGGYDL